MIFVIEALTRGIVDGTFNCILFCSAELCQTAFGFTADLLGLWLSQIIVWLNKNGK